MKKIAFLSAAHIHTKGFIETIRKDRLFAIAAVWDDVRSRGERYAAMAGGRFVRDRRDILADPTIEGVIITPENRSKQPLLLEAIRAGKAIMCEKPVALTAKEAAAIRAALKRNPKARMISGYYLPYGSRGRSLKAFLASGKLGKPLSVQFRNCHHGAIARWFDNPDLAWFTRMRQAGGGAFLDLGTHAVHYLTWLFGPATQVTALIENQSRIYPDVDDAGKALIQFHNGPLANVEASWVSHAGTNSFLLTGERGFVVESGEGLTFTPAGGTPQPIPVRPGVPGGVRRLAALMDGKIPAAEWRADAISFLRAAVIMEACYASATLGRTIRIKPS